MWLLEPNSLIYNALSRYFYQQHLNIFSTSNNIFKNEKENYVGKIYDGNNYKQSYPHSVDNFCRIMTVNKISIRKFTIIPI